MPKLIRPVLALGAVFLALAVSACGDAVPEGDVFDVDGTTTSQETFDRWLKIAAVSAAGQGADPAKVVIPDPPNFTRCVADKKKNAPEPVKGQPKPTEAQFKQQCQQQYDQLRDQVMTFLIRAEWLNQEAEEQGIEVSDAEVKKQFDQARKQAFPKTEDYENFLKTSGQTEADLLFRQRTQLLEQKITEKVNKEQEKVTDEDVQEYYDKNKESQFTTPASRDLRVILAKDKAQAEKAKREIQSGELTFEEAVKKYSTDPTSKESGGELPNVTQGQGEKAFDDAVFAAPVDKLSGPVKTTDGWYVFEVTKSTPEKVQKLDQQLKESIKQIVASERERSALTEFGQEYQDRWRAKTECQKGYVVPDCANSKTKPASTVPPGAIPQQDTQQQPAPPGAVPSN